MFNVTTNGGVELDGTSDGHVTVYLTAARSETLMGLEGNFAVSDTSGNVNFVSATAGGAVSGMVVGGAVSNNFVLGGNMVEVGGSTPLLVATYKVAAGTPAGQYSIPVTIEAANVDGVGYEDATVFVASVGVSVKQVSAEPVQEQTPASAQTRTSTENESTNNGAARGNNSSDATSKSEPDASGNKRERASSGNGEEGVDDGAASDSNVAENESTTGATTKQKTKNETQNVVLSTDVTEEVSSDGVNVAGIVLGAVAILAVIGGVVAMLVLKQKGIIGKKSTKIAPRSRKK